MKVDVHYCICAQIEADAKSIAISYWKKKKKIRTESERQFIDWMCVCAREHMEHIVKRIVIKMLCVRRAHTDTATQSNSGAQKKKSKQKKDRPDEEDTKVKIPKNEIKSTKCEW